MPESDAELLRVLAANSGWLETGGRAIRQPSDYCTGGDVVGVTNWIGRPEWALDSGLTQPQIIEAVEKHIAGKRLGRRQAAVVAAALEAIGEMRAP